MLFHEIYGAYFQTVARILLEAGASGISEKRMLEIISENAFAESTLVIPDKLKSGEWPLLKMTKNPSAAGSVQTGAATAVSILTNPPTRPLTTLEKQWLKALLDDPRLRLFLDAESAGSTTGNTAGTAWEQLAELLQDVPPLFEADSIEYYDRYSDGDPYTDPDYINRFHTILRAIREKRMLSAEYKNRQGTVRTRQICPYGIEYSAKDDKFRVLCTSRRGKSVIINMGRIRNCEPGRLAETETPDSPGQQNGPDTPNIPGQHKDPAAPRFPAAKKYHVDLLLTDERNALQRAMLHFSDLQKETERIDETHYRIRLWYREDDETEILIRILAYGPMLQVTAPERFISLVRERIEKQMKIGRQGQTVR